MLRTHKFRLTFGCGFGGDFMHQAVAPGDHVASRGRALVHDDVLDRLTAAHGQTFIHNRFERQLFAAAQLVIGGDHGHRTGVLNTLLQTFCRKAAKHHRMRGANAGAGLHGHHAFDGHRHVDDHAVTFLNAHGLQGAGKLADFSVQFLIGDIDDGAVIAFKNDGFFVFGGRAQVAVQAVVGGIEMAVRKPGIKRGVGLVQHFGEGLFPAQVVTGQLGPEAFKILVGLGAHGVVSRHARNAGRLDSSRARWEDPVFNQCGLDVRVVRAHFLSPVFHKPVLRTVVLSRIALTSH